MGKIISFIIPSYNVEQYLRTALDSFLAENVRQKIEVIVVDDGSKDGTAEIAREYEKRFPDVFRLLQKENGGHGSAINVGSKAAVGTFFKIIDADDWVITENLEEFVERLSVCDADVVLTPFHMVDQATGKKELRCMYLDDYERYYTLEEVMDHWRSFDRCLTFHGITYRRRFYEKYRHELPEKVFYEDQEYASIPCCHAEKIQPMDLIIYQYLVGNGNQSVAAQNQLKRISHIEKVALGMVDYRQAETSLEEAGQKYLDKKTEGVILSFYTVANLVNPNKKQGRQWSSDLNRKIEAKVPEFYKGLKKKARIYLLFNLMKMNAEQYEKLLHSSIYKVLTGNHERTIE